MDLILWRHAQAQEARPGQPDLKRALTARGQVQADAVGRWLNRHLPKQTRILVSPAVRTCATAAVLTQPWSIASELGPDQPLAKVLALSGWETEKPGDIPAGATLLVGHQPVLGQLVAHALGLPGGHCAVRKGAVWWLRRRVRDGRSEVVVMTVLHPDWM